MAKISLLNSLQHSMFWQKLKIQYDSLGAREQRLVAALGIFLAIVFIYLLIWRPSWQFLQSSKSDYQQAVSLYQFVQAGESKLREYKNQRDRQANFQQIEAQDLLTTVTATAKSANLKFQTVTSDNEKIKVNLKDIEFNRFVRWLILLQQNQSIVVTEISISRQSEPGRVNATCTLVAKA